MQIYKTFIVFFSFIVKLDGFIIEKIKMQLPYLTEKNLSDPYKSYWNFF